MNESFLYIDRAEVQHFRCSGQNTVGEKPDILRTIPPTSGDPVRTGHEVRIRSCDPAGNLYKRLEISMPNGK